MKHNQSILIGLLYKALFTPYIETRPRLNDIILIVKHFIKNFMLALSSNDC